MTNNLPILETILNGFVKKHCHTECPVVFEFVRDSDLESFDYPINPSSLLKVPQLYQNARFVSRLYESGAKITQTEGDNVLFRESIDCVVKAHEDDYVVIAEANENAAEAEILSSDFTRVPEVGQLIVSYAEILAFEGHDLYAKAMTEVLEKLGSVLSKGRDSGVEIIIL